MELSVWVGFVEVRQLPVDDPPIKLSGKGAFTWVACWAVDEESYRTQVAEMFLADGLFIVDVDNVMPSNDAADAGLIGHELAELVERVSKNMNYCIFGTFHTYRHDN